ncbi:MAG: GNAT family N-acetyltransferase, partial [Geminicoccaceae bacterium]
MADNTDDLHFRDARHGDVPSIIRLLADDALGRSREHYGDVQDPAYLKAFERIDADPQNRLIVADLDGRVVGCMQLTMIPHMTFRGGTRLQIEGVRVDPAFRARQIGGAMMQWAIALGREHDCHLAQL